MNKAEYLLLKARVEDSMKQLSYYEDRLRAAGLIPFSAENKYEKLGLDEDEIYRIVGSILCDYYTELENIIKVVISTIHVINEPDERELLEIAVLPVEGYRPKIISKEAFNRAEEYLGFRYAFTRNYSVIRKKDRAYQLVKELQVLNELLKEDIDEFIGIMDSVYYCLDPQLSGL